MKRSESSGYRHGRVAVRTLRELLHGLTAEPLAAVPITGIACHSKQVRPGDLFVAIRGEEADGHLFIDEAISRGAAAVVAQRLPAGFSRACPCVVVRDTREALAGIAATFYDAPSRRLRLIGVTGTNGKTTTTYLIKGILDAAGVPAGLLGTVVYQIGDRAVPSVNTTPGPLELQRFFAQMVAEGIGWCAMEVSSHALAQGRVAGLEFSAAIFSNLGSDHLDYHRTRDAYAAAKRRLFDFLHAEGCAVINVDDEYGRVLAETMPNRTVVTYGMEHPAQVKARQVVSTWRGLEMVLDTRWGIMPLATSLLGRHNVWNITAAAAALLSQGVRMEAIRAGLASMSSVPGRLERVPNDLGLNILIDYAHTTEALRLVLLSLRELTRRRLIVVFGCGGNRDQTKRPAMGRMANLLADYVILTSDNPRGEHPLDIVHQIKGGFLEGFRHYQVILDREQAILAALSIAQPDDTILIAGKGHESYQIFDHVSVPFVDRDVVGHWLKSRHSVALVAP